MNIGIQFTKTNKTWEGQFSYRKFFMCPKHWCRYFAYPKPEWIKSAHFPHGWILKNAMVTWKWPFLEMNFCFESEDTFAVLMLYWQSDCIGAYQEFSLAASASIEPESIVLYSTEMMIEKSEHECCFGLHFNGVCVVCRRCNRNIVFANTSLNYWLIAVQICNEKNQKNLNHEIRCFS